MEAPRLGNLLRTPKCELKFMGWAHRESRAREDRGWGIRFFRQIEPNGPLPYSTV